MYASEVINADREIVSGTGFDVYLSLRTPNGLTLHTEDLRAARQSELPYIYRYIEIVVDSS